MKDSAACACTPEVLPVLLERALKGQSLEGLDSQAEMKKGG